MQEVAQLKHIPLFLLLILILTSCSKQPVEKKIIKPIPGIISETLIQKAEKKYDKCAQQI